jgi:hypothetical protein
MPGVFPDYPTPVIRSAGEAEEMVLMRWGMPPSRTAWLLRRTKPSMVCGHEQRDTHRDRGRIGDAQYLYNISSARPAVAHLCHFKASLIQIKQIPAHANTGSGAYRGGPAGCAHR